MEAVSRLQAFPKTELPEIEVTKESSDLVMFLDYFVLCGMPCAGPFAGCLQMKSI
jgi:hypothetical protein